MRKLISKRATGFGIMLLLIAVPFVNNVRCQSRIRSVASLDAYYKVVDLAFSRQIPDTKETDWQIVIRLTPTYQPEFQYVLRKTVNGCTLTRLTAEESIWSTVNDWLDKHGNEDIAQMVAAVNVRSAEAQIPRATANRWKNEFFGALRRTMTSLHYESGEFDRSASWTIYIHPTKYEVWFTNKSTELSLSVDDQDIRSKAPGRLPLVRWINRFRPQTPKL